VRQSLKAVRMGGIISLVGHLDSSEPLDPPFNPVEVLASQATIRAIGAGNRQDFVALMRAIDANHIKPVIDKKVFKMDEAREAYQHMVGGTCPILCSYSPDAHSLQLVGPKTPGKGCH
jgi:D-arabinose 1-dehydrogenase-like Zn-dependent alcohol dehydrogenase